jgi:hypothetical protein
MTEYPDILEFEVSQDHINSGIRKKCDYCPISIAVKEKFPDCGVYTSQYQVTIIPFNFDPSAVYTMSDEGAKFITAFDYMQEQVSPIVLRLKRRKYGLSS